MINEIAQKQIDNIAERCKEIKPLVAIKCMTFNHGPYIKDALEGFVIQKTNFPFIAIIHDDASTDDTAKIIKEYAKKYPDIIFPIYEEKNQFSQKSGSVREIMDEACLLTMAKYVALCEGDDYWTDPNKLQKQVDFLESHPDFSMCFHNAIVHYENKERDDHEFYLLTEREYQLEEVCDDWMVPTASMVIRSSVYKSEIFNKFVSSSKFVVGDNPLIRCCGLQGKIYGFNDISCVYRKQSGGWTNNLDREMIIKLIEQEIEYVRVFGERFKYFSKRQIGQHSRVFWSLVYKGKIKLALKVLVYSLKYAPKATLNSNIKFAKKTLGFK